MGQFKKSQQTEKHKDRQLVTFIYAPSQKPSLDAILNLQNDRPNRLGDLSGHKYLETHILLLKYEEKK